MALSLSYPNSESTKVNQSDVPKPMESYGSLFLSLIFEESCQKINIYLAAVIE